jgi:hypothetical protein
MGYEHLNLDIQQLSSIGDCFNCDIARMNKIYELPIIQNNLPAILQRIQDFKSILMEECREIDDVFPTGEKTVDIYLEIRTNLADLLGDIIVYCTSEALRWNIPMGDVLRIIMESNFSKLDEDGKPIKDSRGKFLKGPNYWKPEDKIRELLVNHKLGE